MVFEAANDKKKNTHVGRERLNILNVNSIKLWILGVFTKTYHEDTNPNFITHDYFTRSIKIKISITKSNKNSLWTISEEHIGPKLFSYHHKQEILYYKFCEIFDNKTIMLFLIDIIRSTV